MTTAEAKTEQFDPEQPEKGWHEAEPLNPPRTWWWLQRIVDWLCR